MLSNKKMPPLFRAEAVVIKRTVNMNIDKLIMPFMREHVNT